MFKFQRIILLIFISCFVYINEVVSQPDIYAGCSNCTTPACPGDTRSLYWVFGGDIGAYTASLNCTGLTYSSSMTSVVWYLNGNVISNVLNNSIISSGGLTLPFNIAGDDIVTVKVSYSRLCVNANGQSTTQSVPGFSKSFTVPLNKIPTIPALSPITSANNISGGVQPGSSNTYSVPANGAYSYLWSVLSGGATINSGASANQASVTAPQASGNFTLKVETWNPNVCPAYKVTTTIGVTVNNTPPTAPVLSIGSGSTKGAKQLTWTASTDNETVATYRIYVSVGGGPFTQSVFTSNTQYLFSQPGVFSVQVRAVDNLGLETTSNTIAITNDDVAPQGPASISYSVNNKLPVSVLLSWPSGTDQLPGSGLKGYNIYHDGKFLKFTNNTFYIATPQDLGSSLNQTFAVTSLDNNNNESAFASAASTTFSVDAQAPTAPTNLTVTGMTLNSITLGSTAATDNSGQLTYKLYWTKNGIAGTTQNYASNTFSLGSGLVAENDLVTMYVTAIDATGNESAPSNTVKAVIDITPPTIPANFRVLSKGRNIVFGWDAATNNIAGYILHKDNDPVNADRPEITLSYTERGKQNDIYVSQYSIQAIDLNGRVSAISSPLSVAPVNFVIDPVTSFIGIGIYPPLEKLHVDGNIRIEAGSLLFNGTDDFTNNIGRLDGPLLIQSNLSNTRNTILNLYGGNVGIGTSVPGHKLTVNGNISALNITISGSLTASTVTSNVLNVVSISSSVIGATRITVNTITSVLSTTTSLIAQNLRSDIGNIINLTTTSIVTQNLKGDAGVFTNLTTTGFKVLDPNTFPAAYWYKDALGLNTSLKVQGPSFRVTGTQPMDLTGSVLSSAGVFAINSTQLSVNSSLLVNGAQTITDRLTVNNGIVTSGDVNVTGNVISGKIGIGKTPVEKLEVAGNIVATGIKIGTGPLLTSLTSSQWTTNGTTINYAAGRVGIGAASPLSTLHINGDINLSTSTLANYNIWGSKLIFSNNPTDYFDNTDYIYFSRLNTSSNNSELRLVLGDDIGGDDKFVIGTTNGGWKEMMVLKNENTTYGVGVLIVKGRVESSEFRVCLAPGTCPPDYVFENDYKLMDLASLKKYLQDNKHLPEVPSAKDMLKNGLNMSEMNLMLLKKLEENTLYILEMEEKFKKMEIRYTELEQAVKTLK